jgi:hypothetical protein
MTDNYSLNKCSVCGKHKALKNGVCKDCSEQGDMPEFLRNLFGDKNDS